MKKALSLTVIIHLCLSCGLGAQNMVTEAETLIMGTMTLMLTM